MWFKNKMKMMQGKLGSLEKGILDRKYFWYHPVSFPGDSHMTTEAGSGCFNEVTARPADMTSKSI